MREGLEYREGGNCDVVITQQMGKEAQVSEGVRVEEKTGQEQTGGASSLTKDDLMAVESSKTGTAQEKQPKKLKTRPVMLDIQQSFTPRAPLQDCANLLRSCI